MSLLSRRAMIFTACFLVSTVSLSVATAVNIGGSRVAFQAPSVLGVPLQAEGAPPRRQDCTIAVSTSPAKNNEQCAAICRSSGPTSAEFKKDCGFVDYWMDNISVKSDDCYAMQIYGYVRAEGARERAGYKWFTNVETPHECQTHCQADGAKCVNWIWMDHKRSGGEPNCFLKSQTYIDHSWLGSGVFNKDWCNIDISDLCYKYDHYECVGVNTCIWCSQEWLSGPQTCFPPTLDDKGSLTSPQAGPDGFPICDGKPDIHITTVNPDPDRPTRPTTVTTYPPHGQTTKPTTTIAVPTLVPTIAPPPVTQTGPGGEIITSPTGAAGSTEAGGSTTTTTTNTTAATEPGPSPLAPIAGASAGALVVAAAAFAAYKYATQAPPQLVGEFEDGGGSAEDDDKDLSVLVDDDVFVGA